MFHMYGIFLLQIRPCIHRRFIQIIQVETIVFVSKIWIREETNWYIKRFIYNLHQKEDWHRSKRRRI